jgi:hypothetical protein
MSHEEFTAKVLTAALWWFGSICAISLVFLAYVSDLYDKTLP